jgi:outer membrane immunogenic protein
VRRRRSGTLRPAFDGGPVVAQNANRGIISNSSHSVNGFLGGIQAGWNAQSGYVVYGVEGQFSWSNNVKGRGNCGLIALFNCGDVVNYLGTAALRLGFTVDHALIYIKGGLAYANDQYSLNILGIANPNTFSVINNANRWGVMWGTGVEYMFTRNWSAKIEYNYMDFGTRKYSFANNTGFPRLNGFYNDWDINQRMHLIKFGLNYHFSSYVVAKY